MGKMKQARPGLDGMSADSRPSVKARRVARKESRAGKRKLKPGGKKALQEERAAQKKVMDQLIKDRKSGAAERRKKLAKLEKTGVVVDPTTITVDPDVVTPNYRFNVSIKKMIVYAEVNLPKVPTQKIDCNPTKDHLIVDTIEHSKKYYLKVPYPDGLKVDPEGLAEISPAGVLSIKLKITETTPEAIAKDSKKQESIEAVKHLRFRTNNAGETIAAKVKRSRSSDAPAVKKPKTDDTSKPEAGQRKKKKTLVTDKNQALQLLESVQAMEEPKKKERKTMLDHANDMKDERKERRQEKRQRKASMEDQAMKTIINTKKEKTRREQAKAVAAVQPLKKPTGRRVKFAA
eukprot:TRINITY_DN483_c1_g1_i1.p1 TRINITY_DN483_c1_g1~~TRINITY_DN483_c1_g1_i1.p1  ORF type:complete len:367 (+),score=83.38 TRINITY_DN483_c1_g1_i1:61-1101(+)